MTRRLRRSRIISLSSLTNTVRTMLIRMLVLPYQGEERAAKVLGAGACTELGDGALGQDLAAADDSDAGADILGLIEQVRGKQDALSGLGEGLDRTFDGSADDWIEAAGGFIQN